MELFGIRLGKRIPSGATTPLKGVGKDVPVPSGETINLEGLQTWQVTWIKRMPGINVKYPEYAPIGQLFTNEDDAYAFKSALEDAYALVKNTADPQHIKVEKMA